LNLDLRDLKFWFDEAQRKTLKEKIEALRMSRMAWAESGYVRDEIMSYQTALAELDGTSGQHVSATWDDMKLRKRG
jgi:hypothetical protein